MDAPVTAESSFGGLNTEPFGLGVEPPNQLDYPERALSPRLSDGPNHLVANLFL